MNTLVGEIIILLLVATTIALSEYNVYTNEKKRGYKVTYRQILRLQMIVLKSAIIDTARLGLLFLVMFLPLIGITEPTKVAVKFVFNSLLTNVRSPLPADVEILVSFLFLVANITIVYYFLGKYGSIYKLALISLIRNDIMQFLEKHEDVYIALLAGSAMYVVTIYSLFTDLVTSQLPLIKIVLGIIIVLLLVYVLPNKKYENAIELIEKIWSRW
jgi:hypothetical protein